ncbi:MAG TPA: glycogen debranching N-terminal domain-containing protein [Streptosporangiaceae bacterium]|jgi:glycogen debranching enzyme
MTEPAAQQIPSPVTPGAITLLEGTAFCVCPPSGDIRPGGTDGVYYRDTRLASRWELLVDGDPVEPMAVLAAQPFCATFVGRSHPRPGRAESTVLVTRTRYVGDGMREDITVQNFAEESIGVHISLRAESDLAGIFDVKAGRNTDAGLRTVDAGRDGLLISSRLQDRLRGVRVSAHEAAVSPGGLSFTVVVEPRGTWRVTVLVQPMIDGQELAPRFPLDQPIEDARPAQRRQLWERDSPVAATTCGSLSRTLRRSRDDLGSLRIFDPDRPDRPAAVAAGAPWFMTIFGRDSVLTSCMALPLDQSLAVGTVRTLAELQGDHLDPLTEEEPGKIIHEVRHGESVSSTSGPNGSAYYGSVDATPLFVMLLGELHRWGVLPGPAAEELLPHADRAMAWIERYGDVDGDGFVEYRRRTDRGLVNQGWKDSFDGINFADGTIAQPPIALAEVQGYVYAAYLARAHIARDMGDAGTARRYEERAAGLKRAFNETFWLPDQGWYAVGLDRDKRPIDALASNMGHCLFTGIVDAGKAQTVADQLMSPPMFTGWGIRTLASSMRAYNPMSYHNGSVWPHDNAIIAAGLMRYGFTGHAQRAALGMLAAARWFDHRLPELFCGFDRTECPQPLPYPTSCSPQAWASAAPLLLLRMLLRFEPCVPCRQLRIAPALPDELGEIRIDRLPFAGGRVSIRASGDSIEVSGLPPDIELVQAPASEHASGGHGEN